MKRRYTVVLTPELDGSAINVISPDIPELATGAATRQEALRMARDCAEQLILSWLDHGEDVPEAGPGSELATIEIDLDELAARLRAERAAATA